MDQRLASPERGPGSCVAGGAACRQQRVRRARTSLVEPTECHKRREMRSGTAFCPVQVINPAWLPMLPNQARHQYGLEEEVAQQEGCSSGSHSSELVSPPPHPQPAALPRKGHKMTQ